jgi:hypothetical protein
MLCHPIDTAVVVIDAQKRCPPKTMTLTGSRFCISVMSSPNIMVSPQSPARAILSTGERGLRADRERQDARHRAVIERSRQPAPSVHRAVPRRPEAVPTWQTDQRAQTRDHPTGSRRMTGNFREVFVSYCFESGQ